MKRIRGERNKGRRASIGYRDKSRCVRRRSLPPFYFPEISRLDLYVEPAGQKDDRSARSRPILRARASGRAIALSLIFSNWLAGLPIWPITDELRGTANRNYMVGATIEFARERDRSSKVRYVSLSLSFSPSPSFSLSRRLWFWIRSMPLGLGSNK